jgi:hypothetical protein
MNCSNCEKEVAEKLDVLMVTRGLLGRAQIAVICRTCEENVLTLKIVLKREAPSKEFGFEGYLPVASVR